MSLIHVVLRVSFSFRISIQRKELEKTMASGNSHTRSSISPIRLGCSIRVYLNFALRKQEKLNNLLTKFVYTNRHLIDTDSSFCVLAGGQIFFAKSCSVSFFLFILLNRLRVFNHVTDAVRFIYQILGQSNFALRKLSYFLSLHKALLRRLP